MYILDTSYDGVFFVLLTIFIYFLNLNNNLIYNTKPFDYFKVNYAPFIIFLTN